MRRAALFAGALASSVVVSAGGEPAPAPKTLEGRPPPEWLSPLQARIDAARPGDTVVVEAGEYRGDVWVDKPLRLVGRGRPRLVGSGEGSVVLVRAPDVLIQGFDIDGLGGGNLGEDDSGVHVAGERVTVRDCRVENTLFGVYLRQAHGSAVVGCRIRGIPGKSPGEKGSGIHVWYTDGFRFQGNDIREVRDGFYIQSSYHGIIRNNLARDLRYGLHYMFSDDNLFEDNTFMNGDAGTALMYSQRIVFRRNRFLHNRGFASVGLLFKTCDDVLAEDNLLADNARGIFIEGSNRNVFRRNVIAESDVAVVVYTSALENRFEDNAFVANLSPLLLEGRRTDTVFRGNYYSSNPEPDLDGDGRSDRPYRLSSVFDHFRGNLTAADLFAQSFAASAIGAAEEAFPVLRAVTVEDPAPRVRPPRLPDVPAAPRRSRGAWAAGLAGALGVLCAGGLLLTAGWSPRGRGGWA